MNEHVTINRYRIYGIKPQTNLDRISQVRKSGNGKFYSTEAKSIDSIEVANDKFIVLYYILKKEACEVI